MSHPAQARMKILRTKDVIAILCIGESTLYDWLQQKSPRYKSDFPKPRKIGSHNAWLEADIEKWLMVQFHDEQSH